MPLLRKPFIHFDYISGNWRSSYIFGNLILDVSGLSYDLLLVVLHLGYCSLILLQNEVAITGNLLGSSKLLHVCLRRYWLDFLELAIVLYSISLAHIWRLLVTVSYQIIANGPVLDKFIILFLLYPIVLESGALRLIYRLYRFWNILVLAFSGYALIRLVKLLHFNIWWALAKLVFIIYVQMLNQFQVIVSLILFLGWQVGVTCLVELDKIVSTLPWAKSFLYAFWLIKRLVKDMLCFESAINFLLIWCLLVVYDPLSWDLYNWNFSPIFKPLHTFVKLYWCLWILWWKSIIEIGYLRFSLLI